MTLTPRDKQNLKTFGYGVLAVLAGGLIYPVSYTHLTLPTICSV